MTTKHTPGPWNDDTGPLLGADDVTPVGDLIPGQPIPPQLPRIMADRALMKAAPDMLAALRFFRSEYGDKGTWPDADVDALTMAEAAIAKAEG